MNVITKDLNNEQDLFFLFRKITKAMSNNKVKVTIEIFDDQDPEVLENHVYPDRIEETKQSNADVKSLKDSAGSVKQYQVNAAAEHARLVDDAFNHVQVTQESRK